MCQPYYFSIFQALEKPAFFFPMLNHFPLAVIFLSEKLSIAALSGEIGSQSRRYSSKVREKRAEKFQWLEESP